LLFSSPPHPFRQYANMRLQNYIRTWWRPSVPDNTLVNLLSAITLDKNISLLMNRRALLWGSSHNLAHIDSNDGTDDDNDDNYAELSFTNANNDQGVNEISTALVNLRTSSNSLVRDSTEACCSYWVCSTTCESLWHYLHHWRNEYCPCR
jgi:hypothetical protein